MSQSATAAARGRWPATTSATPRSRPAAASCPTCSRPACSGQPVGQDDPLQPLHAHREQAGLLPGACGPPPGSELLGRSASPRGRCGPFSSPRYRCAASHRSLRGEGAVRSQLPPGLERGPQLTAGRLRLASPGIPDRDGQPAPERWLMKARPSRRRAAPMGLPTIRFIGITLTWAPRLSGDPTRPAAWSRPSLTPPMRHHSRLSAATGGPGVGARPRHQPVQRMGPVERHQPVAWRAARRWRRAATPPG